MHIQVIFTPIMWYNYPIKKNNLSEAENTMTNNNTDKDKTLKQREQIPNEYKWDIEAMYPDETAWDRDVADSLKAAEDFKRFQTLDYHSNYNLCCYLKAVSFKKVLNPSFEGYLEIEFKPYTPYWYSIPTSSPTLLDGEIKSIVNYSNLYETYKPKVKITNKGTSSTNIKVINESNNTFIEVLGLSDNEVVIIDCKMGTVINSDNINRFEILQDYNLLELSKGDNKIRLNGNAKVEFICEFPIII